MNTILRRGDIMGRALEGVQRRMGGLDLIYTTIVRLEFFYWAFGLLIFDTTSIQLPEMKIIKGNLFYG
jgi:hypothetical protein